MRTKQEINKTISILREKGDDLSLIQADILEGRRTEAWVFDNFVKNVSERNKDEAAFYAARDAARYMAGHITETDLLPGTAGKVYEPSDKSSGKMIYVDSDLIMRLIEQVDRLEGTIGRLLDEPPKLQIKKADASVNDFVNQTQACKSIGCSRVTLRSWTAKGLVPSYRKMNTVYYSLSELEQCAVVQNFKTIQ